MPLSSYLFNNCCLLGGGGENDLIRDLRDVKNKVKYCHCALELSSRAEACLSLQEKC